MEELLVMHGVEEGTGGIEEEAGPTGTEELLVVHIVEELTGRGGGMEELVVVHGVVEETGGTELLLLTGMEEDAGPTGSELLLLTRGTDE